MKIFSRAELEHAVKLDTVELGVIRNGFVALAEDRVVMPSILAWMLPKTMAKLM